LDRGRVVPRADGPGRQRSEGRADEAHRELVVGAGLLVAVAVVGLYLAWRPETTLVDRWLLQLIHSSGSPVLADITSLRYPAVIVVGAVLVAVLALPTDRLRALGCLVSPPLALATCELVVKPLVGRHIGSGLSYPSGSTAGAAALSSALVLAVPHRWRLATLVVAIGYTLWMSVAVVALRWHYPTDALAGAAWGLGVVLVVDGTVLRTASWLRARRFGQRPAPSGVTPSGGR
jgi:undecaprenyl-diphosphatase